MILCRFKGHFHNSSHEMRQLFLLTNVYNRIVVVGGKRKKKNQTQNGNKHTQTTPFLRIKTNFILYLLLFTFCFPPNSCSAVYVSIVRKISTVNKVKQHEYFLPKEKNYIRKYRLWHDEHER